MGRLRGASVLGQPLDLTVPLQVTGDENAMEICVNADVYYGEFQVEPSLVSANLDTSERAHAIRLSVRRPVDEPVVTLYVKTGCQQQSVRKYVLLSEFATEIQRPPTAPIAFGPAKGTSRATSVFPGTTVVASPPSAQRERPTKSTEKADIALRSDATEQRGRAAKTSPTSQPILTKRSEAVAKGARLKLLPLELTQSWEPILRSTDELTLPSEAVDDKKRSEAANLWRVINASPEEILQEASKRGALEAELRSLVAVSRSNQEAIRALNIQLKEAQETRLFNPAVYLLLSLLVGCGVAFGFAFYFRRHPNAEQPWWAGGEQRSHSDSDISVPRQEGASEHISSAISRSAEPIAVEVHEPQPSGTSKDTPVVQAAVVANVEQSQWSPHTAGSIGGVGADFAHSFTGALRAINTQEMVDVRQQADFFLALGQHDDAIGVLYGALGQSTDSNPYIYLDLIALLHKLSRKDEYERVRTGFNMLYSGVVPAYGAYSESELGLLDYPGLYSPLVGLWPTRQALDYIEQCLVRESTDGADTGISLEAFKDLLLLHGILRNVVAPEQPTPSIRLRVPLRKLPVLNSDKSSALSVHVHQVLPGNGLDLDLT